MQGASEAFVYFLPPVWASMIDQGEGQCEDLMEGSVTKGRSGFRQHGTCRQHVEVGHIGTHSHFRRSSIPDRLNRFCLALSIASSPSL